MNVGIKTSGHLLFGTEIVNLDNGEKIPRVRSITFRGSVDEANRLTIEVLPKLVEITTDGILVCDYNGKRYKLTELTG